MSEPDYNLGIMGLKLSNQEVGTIISGALGSLIYMRFLGKMPWYERFSLIVCGGLTAFYVEPLVTRTLQLQEFSGTVGFFTGVFGMAAIYAALSTLTKFGANPLEWLRVALARVRQ